MTELTFTDLWIVWFEHLNINFDTAQYYFVLVYGQKPCPEEQVTGLQSSVDSAIDVVGEFLSYADLSNVSSNCTKVM